MKVYCDSSKREACYIIDTNPPVVTAYAYPVTCNEGEYLAILLTIQELHRKGINGAEIFSDSELAVQQINGNFACRKPRLLDLLGKARAGLELVHATLSWSPREENLAGIHLERTFGKTTESNHRGVKRKLSK